MYGASSIGSAIKEKLEEYSISVSGFVDRRAEELTEFCGCKVITYEELCSDDMYVISCIWGYDEEVVKNRKIPTSCR